MTDPEPTVLVPAGAPFLDAATWVGESCRAELDLHRLLTLSLASGVGAELTELVWAVRAHRAEIAEAWHRRLPELREFPRRSFLEGDGKPHAPVATAYGDLGWLVASLSDRLSCYRERTSYVVGPADGPVADTLAMAIARTEDDLGAAEQACGLR